MNDCTKAVVTVTEMARMVGLSRARFYQLVSEGVFPPPVYCVSTRRPIYVEDLQKMCLEVRHRNCGVNGRFVVFYSVARPLSGPTKPRQRALTPTRNDRYTPITAAMRGLGLAATGDQVAEAVKTLYPNGTGGVSEPEVIRAVFLHLRRRDCGDSVGR